jgi:hypothetical protein
MAQPRRQTPEVIDVQSVRNTGAEREHQEIGAKLWER